MPHTPPLSSSTACTSASKIPWRILLADDDASTRVAMEYVLLHLGYDVTLVANGRECLSTLTDQVYDLVILDIHMPVLDGITTLAALKRNPTTTEIPVILMTQEATSEKIAQCRSLGAASFITKGDLQLEELTNTLAHAINDLRHPKTSLQNAEAQSKTPDELSVNQQTDSWAQIVQSIPHFTAEQTRQAVETTTIGLIFSRFKKDISRLKPNQVIECAKFLEMEPAALYRVLTAANRQAQAARSRPGGLEAAANLPGSDVLAAIDLLGMDQVRQIVEQIPQPDEDSPMRPWILRWWYHAITVSNIADTLAVAFNVKPPLARTAGMLCGIGRLGLLNSELGQTTTQIYDAVRNLILPTSHCEQMMLGVDHMQLGVEFCNHHHLPDILAMSCLGQEVNDLLRSRMSPPNAALSALLSTSVTLANSAGFGALPGSELQPFPKKSDQITSTAHIAIEKALEKTKTTAQWWLGRSAPQHQHHLKVDITGISILMLTNDIGPWNPYKKTLTRAGAHVVAYPNLTLAKDHLLKSDLVLLDQTSHHLHQQIETVRQAADHFSALPVLLLAMCSDDPHHLIDEAQLPVHVYATPIRVHSLLQAIRRLTTTKPERNDQ